MIYKPAMECRPVGTTKVYRPLAKDRFDGVDPCPPARIVLKAPRRAPGTNLRIISGAFSKKAIVEYALHRQAFVRLEIWKVKGRKVCSLVNKRQGAGSHRLELHKGYPAGMYVCRLMNDNEAVVKKFSLR